MWIRTIIGCCFTAWTFSCHADVHHGVWFWGSTTLPDASSSPYGSTVVVGDVAKENECILFFEYHHIKRIYGSYQNRPVSEPSVIAAWNGKLDAAGIQSQLLIDGDAVNDSVYMLDVLNKVSNRLISFNTDLGTNVHQMFDALHLDLEPQKLALWDSGAAAVKRELLGSLLQAYADIRSLLDSSGYTNIPMYADIPFTWDKLPGDGGSIGWTNAADRDGWYADIAGPLDGVSIMTFSKNSFADVEEATDYERSGIFSNPARIAIQGKVGPGEVWTNLAHFTSTVSELDSTYGPVHATDIENLAFWRHSLSTDGPTLTNAPVISISGTLSTGVNIVFSGIPGHIYTVKSSTNFVVWRDDMLIPATSTQNVEMLSAPIIFSAPFSFLRIEQQPVP
jgi:hypothetical protein